MTISFFLHLVRQGIKKENQLGVLYDSIDYNVNWGQLYSLAFKQGLLAVVVDGLEQMSDKQRPPKELMLQWIGEVLQGYEYRYELYRKAIAELALFYNSHNYKMMILKGYACSLNWPRPEHRPCGDIDIWLFGKQKEADSLLVSEKQIKIDKSHHHHTVFYWRDFMVENHYDFVNVYDYKSSAELEVVFKTLGENDSNIEDVCDEKIYMPSPNLHALFIIRHLVSHFCSTNINLRQVLDWAFYIEKHTKEIDWEWLMGILDKYHMREFFNLINAICVDDLGFRPSIFPTVQYLPEMKDRVLEDILNPAFGASEPNRCIPRIVYKYKRWQGNAWKQRLCYRERRWDSFFRGMWAHILKPTSI